MSDSLWPHGLQHTRLLCPSPTPRAYSNSGPSNRWCLPTISSSVVPFSSRLQSFPASGSFPRRQFFALGGQSIRVSASASVLPMDIQDWFPLALAGLIFLQSKGLSRVFSSTLQFKTNFNYIGTLTTSFCKPRISGEKTEKLLHFLKYESKFAFWFVYPRVEKH